MPDFKIIELMEGHMTEPLKMLETHCVSGCQHRYRIDEHHPEYSRVRHALEQGDRSIIFCYHKPLEQQMAEAAKHRRG